MFDGCSVFEMEGSPLALVLANSFKILATNQPAFHQGPDRFNKTLGREPEYVIDADFPFELQSARLRAALVFRRVFMFGFFAIWIIGPAQFAKIKPPVRLHLNCVLLPKDIALHSLAGRLEGALPDDLVCAGKRNVF